MFSNAVRLGAYLGMIWNAGVFGCNGLYNSTGVAEKLARTALSMPLLTVETVKGNEVLWRGRSHHSGYSEWFVTSEA